MSSHVAHVALKIENEGQLDVRGNATRSCIGEAAHHPLMLSDR